MLGELKGLETARQLLHGRDASDGFTTLWEKQRLHLSVEAYALLPWYAGLFEEHHLSTARRRLEAYSFDVNSFLDAARRDPPQWSQTALDGLD
jgi:hypothetical protein